MNFYAKHNLPTDKNILMLGTTSDSWGGIASVIALYQLNGLFDRRRVIYLATHRTGTRLEKCTQFLATFVRFFSLLLLRRVSIVHLHAACYVSFWRKAFFLLIADAFGVSTVLHIHSGHFPTFYTERCNSVSRFLVRFVLRRATKVAVVSTALNEWVRANCRPNSVITILNPATSDDHPQPCDREQSTLLFLGHLGKEKGTFDLISAMPAVASAIPNAKLLLCGDGDLDSTKALISELALTDHVEILGWVDEHRRAQLLSTATICVLPSYAEGLPMSILEAMAARLPVVATRIGGVPEAINNGKEGLLIAPGDTTALADSIIHLLTHPDERTKMAQAAFVKVKKKFAAERTISSLERLYDDVLKKHYFDTDQKNIAMHRRMRAKETTIVE